MKIIGIIAEYNPFHNGHLYQMQQARRCAGADYVVVAMSGSTWNHDSRNMPRA